MIVPDGVASVTLRYPAGRASGYSLKISPTRHHHDKARQQRAVVSATERRWWSDMDTHDDLAGR